MSLDFQQVRTQVTKLGEDAIGREQKLQSQRERAWDLLQGHANNLTALAEKVRAIVQDHDHALRCGIPVDEPLTASLSPACPPQTAHLLAADGSQIAPDRHAPVQYSLINVGAILFRAEAVSPPATFVRSELMYGDILDKPLTEAGLALLRDLKERQLLAEVSASLKGPVITVTDGPMELYFSQGNDNKDAQKEFQHSVQEYREVLEQMLIAGVLTAGYVDKPGSNLIVRLLEVASLPVEAFGGSESPRPLQGVRDRDLLQRLLEPGERSAVFATQSVFAQFFSGDLALHFFYVNVGRQADPWLARVDIPRWVAADKTLLDCLHGTLLEQCRLMGARPYPYVLHRAHETAVVTLPEKEQVTQMIEMELRQRGLTPGKISYKQSAKGLQKRTRYKR